MTPVLEICLESLASARAAIEGGADRIELCSALAIGGLTPYPELLRQIRQISTIPVRCLMRPRAGDFFYTEDEIRLMAMQIPRLKDAGADGFVIGCLKEDGSLDEKKMEILIRAADGYPLTLHRAIDVSRDPEETYRKAKDLGIDTVLTSGAAPTAEQGKETIGKLLTLREEIQGPEVLIGSGVQPETIAMFRKEYPLSRAFHTSGKVNIPSAMTFRKEGVPMGIPGFDEWHIQQSSRDIIAKAKEILIQSF